MRVNFNKLYLGNIALEVDLSAAASVVLSVQGDVKVDTDIFFCNVL